MSIDLKISNTKKLKNAFLIDFIDLKGLIKNKFFGVFIEAKYIQQVQCQEIFQLHIYLHFLH